MALPTQTVETDVPMKPYNFPGAKRVMFVPARIAVHVGIVNHSRVRSYQRFTGQTHSTFHDTGNPRTRAAGEYRWLAGGRQGAGAGGYQGIIDDAELYVAGVFDEVTWAQGTAFGNRVSWAWELAFGGNTNWNRALDNACAVHGATLEMADLNPAVALVQHQHWYGKWCSAQVLNRGLTQWVINRVTYWWQQCRAARTGGAPPPVPSEYADPVLPILSDGTAWDGTVDVTINGSKYEAQRITARTTTTLNRRQWAGVESLLTGPALPENTEREMLGWVKGELVNGISEWWIDTDGNRLWAGGIDATPKVDPNWQDVPTELPPGLVGVNGRVYYPLFYDGDDPAQQQRIGRTITVHRNGDLYRWADTASDVVGAVTEGDARTFRYWTRGEALPLVDKDGNEYLENIWYAENVADGARMWSGLSEERPA